MICVYKDLVSLKRLQILSFKLGLWKMLFSGRFPIQSILVDLR